ncbi:hypothetical protein Tco_0352638, partial [Tanacetum coccineum]
ACCMQVRRIEFTEYAVLFGKQIRHLDCETQYAVLVRRFDTSYPTSEYGVSGNGYSLKDKNKAKTRQNRAREQKERERLKPRT